MDLQILNSYIEQGLVKKQVHPTLDLTIYNYTSICQYEKKWDEITLACRGLVLNSQGEVVAKPFSKFFNFQEVEHLPQGEISVSEKLDGSLGILFKYQGELIFASKGSFTSQQAKEFRKIWNEKGYSESWIEENTTYLFELIYPENRICVDYGPRREIILLGVIHNQNGELPLEEQVIAQNIPLPIKYEFKNFTDLLEASPLDNAEGYVVRWADGYRVKVKFEEYCRLHAIITNSSSVTIWRALKEEVRLDSILENVPDEFYTWAKQTINELEEQFAKHVAEIERYFSEIYSSDADRKTLALNIINNTPKQYHAILFLKLDNKPFKDNVWELVKPKHEKAFFNIDNDQ